jgi:hypothetical protein
MNIKREEREAGQEIVSACLRGREELADQSAQSDRVSTPVASGSLLKSRVGLREEGAHGS